MFRKKICCWKCKENVKILKDMCKDVKPIKLTLFRKLKQKRVQKMTMYLNVIFHDKCAATLEGYVSAVSKHWSPETFATVLQTVW